MISAISTYFEVVVVLVCLLPLCHRHWPRTARWWRRSTDEVKKISYGILQYKDGYIKISVQFPLCHCPSFLLHVQKAQLLQETPRPHQFARELTLMCGTPAGSLTCSSPPQVRQDSQWCMRVDVDWPTSFPEPCRAPLTDPPPCAPAPVAFLFIPSPLGLALVFQT